jgi:hypothetical protein
MKRERLLRDAEVWPDVLRPGSKHAHLGHGEVAFITTTFTDDRGRRFFAYPASRGHESFISEEAILAAMFGPDALPAISDQCLYRHEKYEEEPGGFGKYRPTGQVVEAWDHLELRRRAEEVALFGRYGRVRHLRTLMLWNQPPAWEELLRITVAELNVPPDAILTAGRSELGLVKEFLGDAE